MSKNIIENNEELEERLENFCNKNNLSINIFEVAIMGKGNNKTMFLGPSTVKNKNCTYVIKLFINFNIIIIWNYKNNHNMSYPFNTLVERLNKGITTGDKGKGIHSHNQSRVLFEHSENFENLLYEIKGQKFM